MPSPAKPSSDTSPSGPRAAAALPPLSGLTLPLDEQLCFSLYSASMAVGRSYKPLLDDLGITFPQFLVLGALWESDGQSVRAIAERLALDSSTVSPLLKRLVAAGLVARARNPANERQVIVTLTATGTAMRERCACLGEKLVRVSGMSLDRLRAITQEVRAVRDAVAEAG